MPEDILKCKTLPSLASLHEEMGRLLASFFQRQPSPPGWEPPADVWVDPHRIVVRVELPGVPAKYIDVWVSSDAVSIRGNKPRPTVEGQTTLRAECHYGNFSRNISLPYAVDRDKISAQLTNGVLVLVLQRATLRDERRIQIAIVEA